MLPEVIVGLAKHQECRKYNYNDVRELLNFYWSLGLIG